MLNNWTLPMGAMTGSTPTVQTGMAKHFYGYIGTSVITRCLLPGIGMTDKESSYTDASSFVVPKQGGIFLRCRDDLVRTQGIKDSLPRGLEDQIHDGDKSRDNRSVLSCLLFASIAAAPTMAFAQDKFGRDSLISDCSNNPCCGLLFLFGGIYIIGRLILTPLGDIAD